tara:strand:+ start:46 stop:1173 length:1128 start_codon:yes stop_codon:yes gene_type:complete
MIDVYRAVSMAKIFVDEMEVSSGFKLFERSEPSAYARCFAIFIKSLCKDELWIAEHKEQLIYSVNEDFNSFYLKRSKDNVNLELDKPILQLLCFSLSALSILGGTLNNANHQVLKSYLELDPVANMSERGVDKGIAGSGNQAMFMAIILLYADQYLNISKEAEIKKWIRFNTNSLNSNGFWGARRDITYLQFQNGYHQYEIFEYLGYSKAPWQKAAKKVLSLADDKGHFAPYPGGGGCYDYDAVFMLTSQFTGDIEQKGILSRTLETLLSEQNIDGGFCESKLLRENGKSKLIPLAKHILCQPNHLKFSSLITCCNLLRHKHRLVATHWTATDRKWDESNLWDTFFRLSAISRICIFLDLKEQNCFAPNNFPGIG